MRHGTPAPCPAHMPNTISSSDKCEQQTTKCEIHFRFIVTCYGVHAIHCTCIAWRNAAAKTSARPGTTTPRSNARHATKTTVSVLLQLEQKKPTPSKSKPEGQLNSPAYCLLSSFLAFLRGVRAITCYQRTLPVAKAIAFGINLTKAP